MSVRRLHEAKDCEPGSTDWTAIGTRILEAAGMASMVHQAERLRRTLDRQAGDGLAVPDVSAGQRGTWWCEKQR